MARVRHGGVNSVLQPLVDEVKNKLPDDLKPLMDKLFHDGLLENKTEVVYPLGVKQTKSVIEILHDLATSVTFPINVGNGTEFRIAKDYFGRLDTSEVLQEVVKHLAGLFQTTQDGHGTCAAETCINLLINRDIAQWTHIAVELLQQNNVPLADGMTTLRLPSDLNVGVRSDDNRDIVSRYFQAAVMSTFPPPHPANVEYKDLGDGYYVRGSSVRQSNGMTYEQEVRALSALTGSPYDILSGEAAKALLVDPKAPMMLVNLNWGGPGDPHEGHAVLFVRAEVGQDGKRVFIIRNPWGPNHLPTGYQITPSQSNGPARTLMNGAQGVYQIDEEVFFKNLREVVVARDAVTKVLDIEQKWLDYITHSGPKNQRRGFPPRNAPEVRSRAHRLAALGKGYTLNDQVRALSDQVRALSAYFGKRGASQSHAEKLAAGYAFLGQAFDRIHEPGGRQRADVCERILSKLIKETDKDLREMALTVMSATPEGRRRLAGILAEVATAPPNAIQDRAELLTQILSALDPDKKLPLDANLMGRTILRAGRKLLDKADTLGWNSSAETVKEVLEKYGSPATTSSVDLRSLLVLCYALPNSEWNLQLQMLLADVASRPFCHPALRLFEGQLRQAKTGIDHLKTANDLLSYGRYADAISYLKEAETAEIGRVGEERYRSSRIAGEILALLGRAYTHVGVEVQKEKQEGQFRPNETTLDTAKRCYEQAFSIFNQIPGVTADYDIAKHLVGFAELMSERGDQDAAIRMAKEAQQIVERWSQVVGNGAPDHTRTLPFIQASRVHALALAHQAKDPKCPGQNELSKDDGNKLQEALDIEEQTRETVESVYGPNSLEYARSTWQVGYISKKMGRNKDAIKNFEAAEKIFAQHADARNHPDYALLLDDLTSALIREKRYVDAQNWNEKAFDLAREQADRDGSWTAAYMAVGQHRVELLQRTGDVHSQWGEFQEALDLAVHVFDLRVKTFGWEHEVVGWSALKLAELFDKVGIGIAKDFRALGEGIINRPSEEEIERYRRRALLSVFLLTWGGSKEPLDGYSQFTNWLKSINDALTGSRRALDKFIKEYRRGGAANSDLAQGSEGDPTYWQRLTYDVVKRMLDRQESL